jgi:hypothetical protein
MRTQKLDFESNTPVSLSFLFLLDIVFLPFICKFLMNKSRFRDIL